MNESIHLDNLYIALVEPSTTQFHIIRDHLKNLGVVNIAHFENGTAAMSEMLNDQPDLVISAMHLPDMTGTEFVALIRDSDVLREVSFILISSETSFQYIEPIRQAGVIAILPKPFEASQLEQALVATLDFIDADPLNLDTQEIEALSVLIVDDSKLARQHIRKTLTAIGFVNITEAADGREAVAEIKNQYFDLIVTDYHMPVMDGCELVKYIRTNSSQPSVPILMVTSEDNENQLAAIEQAGVSAICGKPFEVSRIRKLIRKIVQ